MGTNLKTADNNERSYLHYIYILSFHYNCKYFFLERSIDLVTLLTNHLKTIRDWIT